MQSTKTIRPLSKVLMTLGLLMLGSVFVFGFFNGFENLDLTSIFVFAQGADEGMSELMVTILDGLQAILQIIYIILWPLMFISGIALDNSLVYGEFINLDSILWTMWNVSKNLANFALGFFVIFEVIKFAFFSQDENLSGVFKVLKGALIAGIGIQASRFIVGVLVDISTILIISIGGLPLSLINNLDIGSEPILGVQGYINLSDTNNSNSNKADAVVYYKRGNHTFPSCRVTKNYVVGGIYEGVINDTIDFSQDGVKSYCAWNSSMLIEMSDITDNKIDDKKISSTIVASSIEKIVDYYEIKDVTTPDTAQQALIKEMEDDGEKELKQHLLNIDGIVNLIPGRTIPFKDDVENIYDVTTKGIDWKTEFVNDPETRGVGTLLGDLMEQSQGFVGPMVTLYVTLLEFSNLHTTSIAAGEAGTGMAFFFEFLMKALVGIMLVVPLIILAIVLLMRIGVLWLVVAFSPLLALLRGFGKGDWATSVSSKISAKNIIGLIFAPVLPVFILGISILFLQTLSNQFFNPANQGQRDSFGLEIKQYADEQLSCATIRGAMEFCYESQGEETGTSIYANLFAWLLVNIFAIGLVWTLIKLSFRGNDITQGVVNTVTSTATSLVGSVPIIPLPGAGKDGGVGYVGARGFSEITGAGRGGQGVITREIRRATGGRTQAKVEQFEQFVRGKPEEETTDTKATTTSATTPTTITGSSSTGYSTDLVSALGKGETFNTTKVFGGSDTNAQAIAVGAFGSTMYKPSAKKIIGGNASITELEQFILDLNGPTGKAYVSENSNVISDLKKDISVKDGTSTVLYRIEHINNEFEIKKKDV